MAEVLGNLTEVGIGSGADATTFEQICVFGGEAIVDYGTYGTNKEYCLSKEEAFVALTDLEFGSQTYIAAWSEGSGDAAKVIIEAAHLASTIAAKTITIETMMNNSVDGSKKGTLFIANFMVTGYKITAKKGEINKFEFTVEQLNTPTETVAEV